MTVPPPVPGLVERLRAAPDDLYDPKDIFAIIREAADEIDRLRTALAASEGRAAFLSDRNVETSMLAHKWMVAHDKAQAGQPYDFPAPADVPEAIARAEALEAALKRIAAMSDKRASRAVEIARAVITPPKDKTT